MSLEIGRTALWQRMIRTNASYSLVVAGAKAPEQPVNAERRTHIIEPSLNESTGDGECLPLLSHESAYRVADQPVSQP